MTRKRKQLVTRFVPPTPHTCCCCLLHRFPLTRDHRSLFSTLSRLFSFFFLSSASGRETRSSFVGTERKIVRNVIAGIKIDSTPRYFSIHRNWTETEENLSSLETENWKETTGRAHETKFARFTFFFGRTRLSSRDWKRIGENTAGSPPRASRSPDITRGLVCQRGPARAYTRAAACIAIALLPPPPSSPPPPSPLLKP